MKKAFAAMGVAFPLLLFVVPASARSIKGELGSALFGGQSSFLSVPNPSNPNNVNPELPAQLPLLSADPDPRRFGTPILAIGSVGSVVANAMSSEIFSESTVIPIPSGSTGFSYVYNPNLNIFERRSIGLGSIFNERVNTLGKGAFAFGVAYVRQDFDEYNGQDISNLPVTRGLFTKSPPLGVLVDTGAVSATLDLKITTNTAAIYAVYGVTDWLDVSFLLPVTEINLRARSTLVAGALKDNLAAFLPDSRCTLDRASKGRCRISDFILLRRGIPVTLSRPDPRNPQKMLTLRSFSDVVDETRAGVGDFILRSKARFFEGAWGAFGGLTELTFPTGDKDNFLGDDAFKARFLLLYSLSFFENRLNFHLNGGGKVTTQTSRKNTLEYGSAVDLRVTERLSLVAELIGSWRVDPEGLPSNFIDGAFGFKANLFRGLIVSASFRIPATNDGLRSDLVYLAGLEYDF